MSKLESYVVRFGAVAGPKLYHAGQSRAAYIGANSRRRATLAAWTGRPTRPNRPASGAGRPTPLLPDESEIVAQPFGVA